MIAQHYNSTNLENNLLKQIKIKENQLKIAQESDMIHVAEELQSQLLKLQSQLSEPQDQDVEIQALMSLLDD
ncbi:MULTISPECIES: hypothetical protein [unclassified Nostoc]|uniref:hypothetical protein n=1 Tax=unclassified Nostoc TaxID=2593658 RepID=UPI002AD3E54E|nr:hypothetical protein [Nostoc sp. DedQUE03]MDZ7974509.1 hypothetical protein [Nostoc sp. DedQUE03]MDZ8047087.1 hypothetical protein [Nostoc sp. DedQUE02]